MDFSRFRRPQPDFTDEAEELFTRFAQRHQLSYEVTDAPVEIMWEFPVQAGLSLPIILALQNGDELNFGVGEFWSYFFPYPKQYTEFERILDRWMEGRARVISRAGFLWQTRDLEVLEDGEWKTTYRAKSLGRRNVEEPLINSPDR